MWALGGPSGLINNLNTFLRRFFKFQEEVRRGSRRAGGRLGGRLGRRMYTVGGFRRRVKRTLRRKKEVFEENSTMWKPFPSLTRPWAASGPGADLYLSY